MYYCICSCPRSGSSLLAEALRAMGAGEPEEYFNPVTMSGRALGRREDFMRPTPEAYLERIQRDHTVNGVFGIKIDYTYLAQFPDAVERLPQLLPGASYISITRRNVLRQAVSATRAIQTQAWTWQLRERKRPRFSYFGVLKHLILAAQEIELWERFYAAHGIKPLRIVYEDLDEDYEKTMRRVAAFLGLSGDIPPPPLQKQADLLSEAWVERCIRAFRGKGPLSRMARALARWR